MYTAFLGGNNEMMYEIRWHGRAGQGVITVSRLLAIAALIEGKYVQAFPEFGPERLGAPIKGFTRIGDEPIEIHSQIYNPDVVVVLDPTLFKIEDVTEGLKNGGKIVVNIDDRKKLFEFLGSKKVYAYSVNATRIALDVFGRAIFNTPMLGALIKATSLVSLNSIIKVIKERFSEQIAEKNIEVLKRAYNEVVGGEFHG
jgi:pyruvate ferredoxin oxidoreductase gamma subunit